MPTDRTDANPVRVGVVGPPDDLQRMVDAGHALVTAGAAMSLAGTSYRTLKQVPDRVRRLAPEVDVFVFGGPLPHDIARDAGVLDRPATYVELSGSSLFGAMLRARRVAEIDLERVSIDSLSVEAIAEAYAECELDRRRVHACPYEGPDSAGRFAVEHRRLFDGGRSTGAFTTVEAVARELAQAGVPAVRVRPTGAALRATLRTAAFLAAGNVFEQSQVVLGVVEIPRLGKGSRSYGPGPWATAELRLAVVRALRAELDGAAVSILPRDEHSIALVATLASITDLTGQFTAAPFVGQVRRATGVTPYVGFGTGATAAAAEANAELALADARAGGGERIHVRLRDGSALAIGVGADDAGPEIVDPKHVEALAALRAGLADAGSDPPVVDAEFASQLLGTSPRTARRVLQDLARDGLAWPVPAAAVTPGRPRLTYRLVGR